MEQKGQSGKRKGRGIERKMLLALEFFGTYRWDAKRSLLEGEGGKRKRRPKKKWLKAVTADVIIEGHGRKTAKKSCDDVDNGMQHTGCLKIIVF
jgi:hypothetical protein